MTFTELFGSYSGPVALGVGLGLGWLWRRARQSRGTDLAPTDIDDPIWTKALSRARATTDEMRAAFENRATAVYVKFALTTKADTVEHVWGELLELSDQDMKLSVVTPPVGGFKSAPPLSIRISQLEDWQFALPDGRVRGGFTSQAQIILARRVGALVPPQIGNAKYVDSLED